MVCLLSFSKNVWSIVGHDVTSAILSAINSGCLLHKMNYTHIVLVPTKNDPQNLGDFRPISLGNMISRLFLKVLANRLKQILPSVISDAQSAFISKRIITNNTTVAFEVLHRRRGKDG